MKIHGIKEYRFVDPRTVVDGKDGRGLVVELLISPSGEGGPPRAVALPAPLREPTAAEWVAFMEGLAERQESYATDCESKMTRFGALIGSRHDPPKHGHVYMMVDIKPNEITMARCPKCASITEDARSATRTAERNHLARIVIQ